jgi:hypothetical protein
MDIGFCQKLLGKLAFFQKNKKKMKDLHEKNAK